VTLADMKVRVEFGYDEESHNWWFAVPALHITGGACLTRQEAERHCLDAIKYALADGGSITDAAGADTVELSVEVTFPQPTASRATA
jgi:hypothetical protein